MSNSTTSCDHQQDSRPSFVSQVLHLCCASYVCETLEKHTGETECLPVAELLMKEIQKDAVIGASGVDAFVTSIHNLDDEFPESLLREIYQQLMPKLAHVRSLLRKDSHVKEHDLNVSLPSNITTNTLDGVDFDRLLFPPANVLQHRLDALSSLTRGGIPNFHLGLSRMTKHNDALDAAQTSSILMTDQSMPHSEESRFEVMQMNRAFASSNSTDESNLLGRNRDQPIHDNDCAIEEDVRVRTELPQFLKNESSLRSVAASLRANHSVNVIKDPRGSLSQCIQKQQIRLKERREVKHAQQRANGNKAAEPTIGPTTPFRSEGTRPTEAPSQRPNNPVKSRNKDDTPVFTLNSTQGFRNKDRSIEEQRKMLKIYDKRESFLQAVNDHQVLVVLGETGSGKTTQMTQYLAEAGYARGNQIIGCTQPRRLPARSVAERVAMEYGCRVGEEVGYTVRFEDETSRHTRIKYMTDGILLREALADPNFSRYRVLIIDEAHERNINTDVLLGLLKRVLRSKLRTDLRLIVTSATLNVQKFSEFFDHAPIFTIPGRSYPVEESYMNAPCEDYIYETVIRVIEIHLTAPEGDILVFLPGKEEIEDVGDRLRTWESELPTEVPRVEIHMIHATLPTEVQARVFLPAPANTRKVILATNIAETSVTIDGIAYVVDPGVFKQNVFNPKAGMDVLRVTPISQAQANQRKGRAGRTGPGHCYRLYTREAFQNEMLPEPVPEIQRSNLSNVVLMMKATGIMDILGFDFIDPPPREILVDALNKLYALGALDDEGLLTQQGRRMAQYPIDPTLSTVLLAASSLGCAEDVLTVIAVLTSEDLFYRPKEKAEQADLQRHQLQQKDGDHMTMYHIFQQFKQNGSSKKWCDAHYLHFRALKYAEEVRDELESVMKRQQLTIVASDPNQRSMLVRQSFSSGFFMNVARRQSDGSYRTMVDQQIVYLHPSCSLFHIPPPWVIYHSVVMTTKEYMREVSPIDMRWLVVMAPRYFTFASKTDLENKREREKIEPLFNKFMAPGEWRWGQGNKRSRH